MEKRIFAVFDDTVQDNYKCKFKIARIEQVPYQHSIAHAFYEEPPPINNGDYIVELCRTQDTDPDRTRMTMSDGPSLLLWRTGWTIFHKNSNNWIPVLDSDSPQRIPGQFLFTARRDTLQDCSIRFDEQIRLRNRMLIRRPIRAKPPAPAPAPPMSIPTFVASILKKTAITNGDTCPISMESFTENTEAVLTSCFHLFEKESITRWLSTNKSCPICKNQVQSVQPV